MINRYKSTDAFQISISTYIWIVCSTPKCLVLSIIFTKRCIKVHF